MMQDMSTYEIMVEKLKTMDEKQLIELFKDISDVECVERIADCAYHFVESNQIDVCESVNLCDCEIKDWQQQDDAQRTADINSTKNCL